MQATGTKIAGTEAGSSWCIRTLCVGHRRYYRHVRSGNVIAGLAGAAGWFAVAMVAVAMVAVAVVAVVEVGVVVLQGRSLVL